MSAAADLPTVFATPPRDGGPPCRMCADGRIHVHDDTGGQAPAAAECPPDPDCCAEMRLEVLGEDVQLEREWCKAARRYSGPLRWHLISLRAGEPEGEGLPPLCASIRLGGPIRFCPWCGAAVKPRGPERPQPVMVNGKQATG